MKNIGSELKKGRASAKCAKKQRFLPHPTVWFHEGAGSKSILSMIKTTRLKARFVLGKKGRLLLSNSNIKKGG